MKKILWILHMMFSTYSSHAALDDIVIPKITWAQLIKMYEKEKSTISLKNNINNLVYQAEKKYGIPHGLLASIAYTESGQYIHKIKEKVIWPWTVNANGQSYYLKNKQEAINIVQKLRKSGIQVIDVGCMQINLLYHAKAFKSLDEALHPQSNIEYAAKFLRTLYDKEKSWHKAVCYYHSKREAKYSKYYCKIMAKYNELSKIQSYYKNIPVYMLCKNDKVVNVMRRTIDNIIAERLHKLGNSILAQSRINH